MIFKRLSFILSITVLISCNSNIEFSKKGWVEKDDIGSFPNRERMLDDLINTHKIKGSKTDELIELLGEPNRSHLDEQNYLYYPITTDYGFNIDPIYIKTLKIKIGRDSVVTDFRIVEWKK